MAQKFLTDIEVTRGLVDSDGDLGVAGQVLSSTGTGTNWITNEANSTVVYQDGFTGDNSTVDFTLSVSVTDENVTQVYIDGVYQTKDTYSVSNTTLTFSTAPPLSADIEVITFSTATTADDLQAGVMIIPVKNTHTASIAKGEPVYITGNVGSSARLQIAPADAGNSAKMPAAGLLLQTLAVNAEGYVVTGGYLRNLTTDTIDGTSTTSNDTVYVKSGGGLTMTKPTGTNLIQNIAKVARVASGNAGSLIVSSILRTNDVPNITNDYFWLGNSSGVATPTEFTSSVRGLISASGNAISYNSSTGIITANYEESPTFTGNVVIDGTTNSGRLFVEQSGADMIDMTRTSVGTYRLAISTSDKFSIYDVGAASDRLVIDSSGNVGIGKTSPLQKLDVEGSVRLNSELQIFTGTTDIGQISNSGGALNIQGTSTRDVSLGSDSYPQAVFIEGSNGRVGIGTISPAKQLTLSAAIPFIRLQETGAGSKRLDLWVDSNAVAHIDANQSAQQITFRTAGTDRLRIANNGNVGIGTTSPSSLLHLYKSSGDAMLNIQAVSAGDPGITFTSINNRTGNIFYSDGSTNAKLTYDHNDVSFKLYAHNTTVADFVLNETTAYFPTQNVGIGTTSPTQPLQILGAGNYDPTSTGGQTTNGILIRGGGTTGDNTYTAGIGFAYGNGTSGISGLQTDGTDQDRMGLAFFTHGSGTGTAASSEAMRIEANGNVGIGVSPYSFSQLHIYDTSDVFLTLQKGTANGYIINDGTNISLASDQGTTGKKLLVNRSAPDSSLIINSSGNVGIGTTSPVVKLNVVGSAYFSGNDAWNGGGSEGNRTDIALVIDEGDTIYTRDSNQYLRTLIKKDTGDNIQIGEAGTSLIDNINFFSGSSCSYTWYNNSSAAMKLTSTGLGIGTTSPGAKLNLYHATDDVSINVNTGTGGSYPKKTGISFGATSTSLSGDAKFTGGAGIQAINTAASGNPTNLTFWTNSTGTPTVRMSILNSGEFCIGTTETAVISTDVIHSIGQILRSTLSSSAFARLVMQERQSNWISFVNGSGGHFGTIAVSGSGVSYGSNSDYRLKENIIQMTGALDRIAQLKPSRFNFIAEPEKTVDGFLAHEVQNIVPEAVTGEQDGTITTGNIINSNGDILEENVIEPETLEIGTSFEATSTQPKYQQLDPAKLVPLLVGAIQELKAEVETLKLQING